LRFASRQIPRRNYFATLRLLERFENPAILDDGERFEIAAFRCLLVDGLQRLLAAEPKPKSGFAKAQATWASSRMDPQNLSAKLVDNLAGARLRFSVLKEPTKPQIALHARVEKMSSR